MSKRECFTVERVNQSQFSEMQDRQFNIQSKNVFFLREDVRVQLNSIDGHAVRNLKTRGGK